MCDFLEECETGDKECLCFKGPLYKKPDCLKEIKKRQNDQAKGSAEFNCSVAEVSQEMLRAGVKAAVRAGIIPRQAGTEEYLKNWAGIKEVISAALLARN
jgi:hypothetical protein